MKLFFIFALILKAAKLKNCTINVASVEQIEDEFKEKSKQIKSKQIKVNLNIGGYSRKPKNEVDSNEERCNQNDLDPSLQNDLETIGDIFLTVRSLFRKHRKNVMKSFGHTKWNIL